MNYTKYPYVAMLASWGVTTLSSAMMCFPTLLFADPPAAQVQSGTSGLHEVTSFDVYVDGRTLHLLVSGKMEGEHSQRLHYERSEDGGKTWSTPVRVPTDAGAPHSPDPGNSVQIAASGDHLLALWSISGEGWHNYGPIATALSSDGGKTWRRGVSPVGHGGASDQSFVDAVADQAGVFHVVWLDDLPDQKRALYAATSQNSGEHWLPARVVDELTCECCANRLVAAKNNLYVLYRDRDPRDMAFATSGDGGKRWRRRGQVGAFHWRIEGCPHTGGGLAAVDHGKVLHATVWTGRERRVGLYYLTSRDGGRHWSPPVHLGDNRSHHNDLAALDARHLLAVWDKAEEKNFFIVASRSDDGGKTWQPPWVLRQSSTLVSQPHVVATPFGFRVFWIEQKEQVGWSMANVQ